MSDKQYEIICNEEEHIVHLNVYGEIEKDVGEKAITEARTKAAENKYNILIGGFGIHLACKIPTVASAASN